MRTSSRAPALPERQHTPPAFHVLTNEWLFSQIIAYQAGMPVALLHFWRDHAAASPPRKLDRQTIRQLRKMIAAAGTPYHLELLQRTRYYAKNRWCVPSVDPVVPLVVETNRADLLAWLLSKHVPLTRHNKLWKVALTVCTTSDLGVVKLLIAHTCPSGAFLGGILGSIATTPSVELLQLLSDTYPDLLLSKSLTITAARSGDLPVLRYVLEHSGSKGCYSLAFELARNAGHFAVLEYLLVHCSRGMSDVFMKELIMDELPELQQLVKRCFSFFRERVRAYFGIIMRNIRDGDTTTLERLDTLGLLCECGPISVDHAAYWKDQVALRFLHSKGLAQATTKAIDNAAERKRWDVVDYLFNHRAEGFTSQAVASAAMHGKMDWMKRLIEKQPESCSPLVMDRACEGGSLSAVRYLHVHSAAGCTTKAMDSAASRGHLRIVRFLHENRTEGCTTDAMDGAARAGLYDMVQYLCDYRTEGCTISGIKGALEENHVEVVELLYEHFPYPFGPELLDDLLLRGAFAVFMKLREMYPGEAESVIEPVIREAGRLMELRTIRFIIDDLGRGDLTHVAKDGAFSRWRPEFVAILDELYPSEERRPTSALELHPFLLDHRIRHWAVAEIVHHNHTIERLVSSAIYHGDVSMLDVIRSTGQVGNGLLVQDAVSTVFEGARVAAIRRGHMFVLKWLMHNIDLPVEPNLLDQAITAGRFEMAEWLTTNYPAACIELDWTTKQYPDFDLRDGFLDWVLDNPPVVRAVFDFIPIIDLAVRNNDVESLGRLQQLVPDLFVPPDHRAD